MDQGSKDSTKFYDQLRTSVLIINANFLAKKIMDKVLFMILKDKLASSKLS